MNCTEGTERNYTLTLYNDRKFLKLPQNTLTRYFPSLSDDYPFLKSSFWVSTVGRHHATHKGERSSFTPSRTTMKTNAKTCGEMTDGGKVGKRRWWPPRSHSLLTILHFVLMNTSAHKCLHQVTETLFRLLSIYQSILVWYSSAISFESNQFFGIQFKSVSFRRLS